MNLGRIYVPAVIECGDCGTRVPFPIDLAFGVYGRMTEPGEHTGDLLLNVRGADLQGWKIDHRWTAAHAFLAMGRWETIIRCPNCKEKDS